ncbi:MAG TPA: hypothetical protein VG983_07075 [Caulobacterales bacterium]|jgi:hypothetical protein|nr:hypothetical protein [Caulobacterales bacterium]
MSNLVEIANFVDRSEAVIADGLLKANGVRPLVPELYTLAADPGLVFALGGYRILVPAEDAALARAILADMESAAPAAPPPRARPAGLLSAMWALLAGTAATRRRRS